MSKEKTMKKWVLTRITHTTIIVESETDPSEDEWNLDDKYGKALDESYNTDGMAEYETDTVENVYGERENYNTSVGGMVYTGEGKGNTQ